MGTGFALKMLSMGSRMGRDRKGGVSVGRKGKNAGGMSLVCRGLFESLHATGRELGSHLGDGDGVKAETLKAEMLK